MKRRCQLILNWRTTLLLRKTFLYLFGAHFSGRAIFGLSWSRALNNVFCFCIWLWFCLRLCMQVLLTVNWWYYEIMCTYFSYILALFVWVFLSSIRMLLMQVFHVHLLFCASIFYRQYTCLLCMYFMYTCFFCKYFSSLIHCFLCVYFMYTCFFVQVFFVVNTHASYACISCALAFLYKYFSSSIHMLLMHVFHVHLLFLCKYFWGSLYGRW